MDRVGPKPVVPYRIKMGSLPVLSILKGPNQKLVNKGEPVLLHKILENTVYRLENNNNNDEESEIIHSIDLCERQSGEKTAIIDKNKKISYTELNESANRLARAIRKYIADVKPNTDGDYIISVCQPPGELLITTLLAVWKIGAAYLPLDTAFPVPRIQHILEESQPVMVIAEDIDNEGYKGYNIISYRELHEESQLQCSHNVEESETISSANVNHEKQLAIVLYTSGSTGIPKGVRLPHSVVLNRIKWQWRAFPYSKTEEICVFKTALTFVDSVSELWGPLLYGRSVLVVSKEDTRNPEELISILDRYKVERLVLVPSLLRSILLYIGMVNNDGTFHREPQKVVTNKLLSNLRLWVCSGEPLPVALAKKFYQYFNSKTHVLCNFYGSTEIMGDVTFHAIASFDEIAFEEKIPIGRPVDNTIIYILDKTFRPVKTGAVGELFVSGLNLAAGYVRGRDPVKFIDNPLAVDSNHSKLYRTGDFAKIYKNTVYYEGRTDSQIKVRGHRVDLVEVETAVSKLQIVDKSVVLCYKAGEIDQALLAFVTTTDSATSKQLEELLERVLAPYMVPQVIIVKVIPLLVNGKVDRQQLLKKYEETFKDDSQIGETDFDYHGITDGKRDKAKVLFETVASVLGKSLRGKITPNSNFYQLGGNSLNSVYTVTKLRDMGFVIGIGDFISSPTLSDVVNRMRTEDTTQHESLISVSKVPAHKYFTEMLNDEHKNEVYSMITSSFYEKADLEQWLMPDISRSDYAELMDALWDPLVETNFSFIVRSTDGEIKGVGLNFDAHDEPPVEITSKLVIVFDFLEFIEGPIRDNRLPKGTGQILHSFMMATKETMSAQENIEVIHYMEEQVLEIARRNGFAGVLTTNTSPLTQQLGTDVYEYKVLLDYQVNKYVAPDGSKPFGKAPESQRAMVSWTTV